MIDRNRGVKHHILTGHGSTQDTFERRDFVTTNDMVYDRKQKVESIIDPHRFETEAPGKTVRQQ